MLEYFGQWETNVTIQGTKVKGRLVVLPMPPSENERLVTNWAKAKEVVAGGYYKDFGGKSKRGAVTNSKIYNQWKHASATLLKKGNFPMLNGEIAVIIVEVFPDKRRRDIDNRVKGLFDAMTQSGHLFADDSQIVLQTVEKKVISKKSFIMAFVLEKKDIPPLWINVNDSFLSNIANTIPENEE